MNFDLNIQNYKKSELEEIFGLPIKYDTGILDIKETKLRESILHDTTISEEIKMKTINFIVNAKNIILSDLNNNSNSSVITSFKEVSNSDFSLKNTRTHNDGGANFVQERKSEAYLSAYPTNYFPGIINPLKKKTIKKSLNIDTRFRENYYNSPSSNFHFDLPLKLSSVVNMQLTAFETPTSFYVISKLTGNNFFTIGISNENISKLVTIPDGNYSPSDLCDYLNYFMTTDLSGTLFSYITFNVGLSNENSGDGKMYVAMTDSDSSLNNVSEFYLDFGSDIKGNPDNSTPLPLKLGWIMGFRNAIYSGNTSYNSEGVVDLSGPRYLYLVVDDYNNNVNNNFYSAFSTSILNKNILARISLQSTVFSLFSQNNFSMITYPREYYGPVDIQKMQIQLLDEYGRIVFLNNMDYSFCLTFETVYDI